MSESTFCSNCGAKTKQGESFCGQCGCRVVRENINKGDNLVKNEIGVNSEQQFIEEKEEIQLDWFDKLLIARNWAVSMFCFGVAMVCLIKLEIMVALAMAFAGFIFYPALKDKVSLGAKIIILMIICLLVNMGL